MRDHHDLTWYVAICREILERVERDFHTHLNGKEFSDIRDAMYRAVSSAKERESRSPMNSNPERKP